MLPALDPLHILALHCNQCPFLTLSVARLFEHCMSHKESSDCTLLQCQQCGIVATHRGILEEHTQAWHPSAPLSVRQISTTTVQAAGSTNGQQFPRYGCQFCSFRSDDHAKVSRHYLAVHNITNVDLHAKATVADGFTDESRRPQQNHSLCDQQQRKQQQSSPQSTASVQLVLSSSAAPSFSSAPASSAAAAASTSPLSAILPTVTLIRQPQQQQQQFLLQSGSVAMSTSATVATTCSTSTAARSASDDSGFEAEPQLSILSGVAKVETLDNSEPTASGEEDMEDSEMITDNSLIMDSVASMRAGSSSILTMSLEPEYEDRVALVKNGGLNLKVFTAETAATAPATVVTTSVSSAVSGAVCAEPVETSTPKPLPTTLTFHQATTASIACKSDKDKSAIKMIPVESFGKRYDVLTRNLRLMGGRLLIGQRLDRGTLDFSCQCRFCRKVVKLSKPKAYKFKIHLRTCKERRKAPSDSAAAAAAAAVEDVEEFDPAASAAADGQLSAQQHEELEDDEEDAEQVSLAASETRPDGGADCPSPRIELRLPTQEIPA